MTGYSVYLVLSFQSSLTWGRLFSKFPPLGWSLLSKFPPQLWKEFDLFSKFPPRGNFIFKIPSSWEVYFQNSSSNMEGVVLRL